ncbi:MAG: hypothetical protein ABR974_13595 [Bacteroidales bacterium]|jgi:hypothetical protein
MKNLPVLILIFISMGTSAYSQSKTYDIVSYDAPSGWIRNDKTGSRGYSSTDKGREVYGLIVIYPAIASSGDARKDFTASWSALVQPVFGTSIGPLPTAAIPQEGYEGLKGTSTGSSSGKLTTVTLVNYTGGGKTVSIVIGYTDLKYEPAVNKFLQSVRLKVVSSEK